MLCSFWSSRSNASFSGYEIDVYETLIILLSLRLEMAFLLSTACKRPELNCSQFVEYVKETMKEYVLDYTVSSKKTKNISSHHSKVFYW